MSSKVPNKVPKQLIDGFYRQADEIVKSFSRELDEEPTPSLLYHYTDGAGLRGILESGKLWFTDIFNLNDPTELRHGLQPAVEIIKQRAKNGPQGLELLSDMFQEIVNKAEIFAHFFVCCFSKDGDDLGQWRAYADNGRGYVIVFDGRLLVQAFVKSGTGNHFRFSITYEDDRLYEMHEKIIDKFIPLYLDMENLERDEFTELSKPFLEPIIRSALFFKHKAYANEKEYRFLQDPAWPLDGVKYRNHPYSLIRYREFDWRSVASGSLKKIIIGPSADRRLGSQFADDCLRAFHKGIVEIDQSEIPYRAL